MIANWKRRLWYGITDPLMWLNGRRYRWLRAPSSGLKVHLGPGKDKYLPGWLNVDANLITGRLDLWANILHPFPFSDGSVEAFYTWHVLEHLPFDSLLPVLREMYRCLQPGGRLRIGVPHFGNAAKAYATGDGDWFCSDFPRKFSSIGGRCANFLLCAGEHLQLLDFSFFAELLGTVGFQEITEGLPKKSQRFEQVVLELESEPDRFLSRPHTLVVEAIK